MFNKLLLIMLTLPMLVHTKVTPEEIRAFLERDCANKILAGTAKLNYLKDKAPIKTAEIHARTDWPITKTKIERITSAVFGGLAGIAIIATAFVYDTTQEKITNFVINVGFAGLCCYRFKCASANIDMLESAQQNELELVEKKVSNYEQKLEDLKILHTALQGSQQTT